MVLKGIFQFNQNNHFYAINNICGLHNVVSPSTNKALAMIYVLDSLHPY
jgi:hypothetical protein